MSIGEFLLARIAEDERWARANLNVHRMGDFSPGTGPWLLADCAAKRAIVEFHQQWPVLVRGEPVLEQGTDTEPDAMVFRMLQRLDWATEQEYVKRFGTEPPTAPILRILASMYADHPDYDPDWGKR